MHACTLFRRLDKRHVMAQFEGFQLTAVLRSTPANLVDRPRSSGPHATCTLGLVKRQVQWRGLLVASFG